MEIVLVFHSYTVQTSTNLNESNQSKLGNEICSSKILLEKESKCNSKYGMDWQLNCIICNLFFVENIQYYT